MSRKLYIIGSIDEDAFKNFSLELDHALKLDKHSPINVEIASDGGSAHMGMAFYGRIIRSPAPIYAEAYGCIQSAATLVLAACHHREAASETVFMVHDSDHKLIGNTSTLKKQIAQELTEETLWASLMASKTKLDANAWMKAQSETTYFTSKQALKYGLIDKII